MTRCRPKHKTQLGPSGATKASRVRLPLEMRLQAALGKTCDALPQAVRPGSSKATFCVGHHGGGQTAPLGLITNLLECVLARPDDLSGRALFSRRGCNEKGRATSTAARPLVVVEGSKKRRPTADSGPCGSAPVTMKAARSMEQTARPVVVT